MYFHVWAEVRTHGHSCSPPLLMPPPQEDTVSRLFEHTGSSTWPYITLDTETLARYGIPQTSFDIYKEPLGTWCCVALTPQHPGGPLAYSIKVNPHDHLYIRAPGIHIVPGFDDKHAIPEAAHLRRNLSGQRAALRKDQHKHVLALKAASTPPSPSAIRTRKRTHTSSPLQSPPTKFPRSADTSPLLGVNAAGHSSLPTSSPPTSSPILPSPMPSSVQCRPRPRPRPIPQPFPCLSSSPSVGLGISSSHLASLATTSSLASTSSQAAFPSMAPSSPQAAAPDLSRSVAPPPSRQPSPALSYVSYASRGKTEPPTDPSNSVKTEPTDDIIDLSESPPLSPTIRVPDNPQGRSLSCAISLSSDSETDNSEPVWPRDFYVVEVAAVFSHCQLAKARKTTVAALFRERVDGTPFTRQTFYSHRERWNDAPASLRERYLGYGFTERGLWSAFMKEARDPRSEVRNAKRRVGGSKSPTPV